MWRVITMPNSWTGSCTEPHGYNLHLHIPFFLISSLISSHLHLCPLISSTPMSSKIVSSLHIFWWKFCTHFESHPCIIHSPPIRILYDPNNIWYKVQIMNFLIMQFSQVSCLFPNTLQYSIIIHPQPHFSLNVSEEHTHETWIYI